MIGTLQGTSEYQGAGLSYTSQIFLCLFPLSLARSECVFLVQTATPHVSTRFPSRQRTHYEAHHQKFWDIGLFSSPR
ncbi:hypothetical protein F5Y14DRAFT_413798 [Nemania sp. NC0429]|nr:hypothetical protein F5Y14DRAFT_413798 [Nemania sp. NC0429]